MMIIIMIMMILKNRKDKILDLETKLKDSEL